MRFVATASVFLCVLAGACDPGGGAPSGGEDALVTPETPPPQGCLGTLWVPGDWDYAMRGRAKVDVALVFPDGTPRPGVVVYVYDRDLESDPEPIGNTLLGKGITGPDGRWSDVVPVPAGATEVFVVASFMGTKSQETVPLAAGAGSIELGRESP
ncbi:MAG: hypothetical protein FJ087_21380 [Deltaproteobacteria bacterium]|nr:hypothetical protein [Deltaproteobacteria bacterium]